VIGREGEREGEREREISKVQTLEILKSLDIHDY
jgi:hypothetical protein